MPTPPLPPIPPVPSPVPRRGIDKPAKPAAARHSRAPLAKAETEAAHIDWEELRREWSGFGVSFLVHLVALTVLALVVMPMEKLIPALTIISQPVNDDVDMELHPIEVKVPEINPIDEPDKLVNAIALPAGAEDDPSLEGAMNALQDESRPGVADFVENVSFETSDTGTLFMTLGQGENGIGLDAEGVGAKIAFYGVKASGRRFVFVTDCSSSMNGPPLQKLKEQLRETISSLPPQAEFHIVFFNSGAIPMPSSGLAKATPAYKRRYLNWADQVPSKGGTDPSQALEIALRLRPSVVFLLTDGVFRSEPTFNVINRLNKARKTQINTIAIGERGAESVLQQIAEENKGVYTFVPNQ